MQQNNPHMSHHHLTGTNSRRNKQTAV